MFIYQTAKRVLRSTGRRIVDSGLVAAMDAITINYYILNRLAKSLKKVDICCEWCEFPQVQSSSAKNVFIKSLFVIVSSISIVIKT